MEKSDQELIALYKSTQDNHYVGVLFMRYRAQILANSMKFIADSDEAEDISSDIYEELTSKLLIHDVANFRSWLFILVRNHCLMKLRKRKAHSEVDIDTEKFENMFVENPSFEHLEDEADSESIRLQKGMAQLKDAQRICLEFFFMLGLSYKEVSDRTGFDLGQVKSNIQNGKRNLLLILSKTT